MTDFIPQKTDQLSGNTSPFQGRVIFEGTTTITMSSQSTGFAGSAQIALPIDTGVTFLYPIGFSSTWNLGGGVFNSYPLPFSEINTSGLVARSGELYITTDLKPLAYILNIVIFDRTTSQSVTVDYKVLSIGF